ncbi:hypothetical protein Lser_V15G13259 [Lactuca serriola]
MAERPLLTPDTDGESVDQTHYRSMIGLLVYLTASHPDIMFAVCQCARYQDSNYGGCKLDRKSTSGGYQFLGDRLVSWQCNKNHTVSTSAAEAEYVVTSAYCSQVIWIQHQLLDYGLNSLETHILCDNEAAINMKMHFININMKMKMHFSTRKPSPALENQAH